MGSKKVDLHGCFGLSASTCCPLLFSVADPLSMGRTNQNPSSPDLIAGILPWP